MTKIKTNIRTFEDGGPAFSLVQQDGIAHYGLSVRDWFAGQAIGLFGFERGDLERIANGEMPDHETAARLCYELADAMLAERERKKSDE